MSSKRFEKALFSPHPLLSCAECSEVRVKRARRNVLLIACEVAISVKTPWADRAPVTLPTTPFELSLRRGGCCICGGGKSSFRSMI